MILSLHIILIAILIFTLVALNTDERYKRKTKIPRGKLTCVWEGGERRCFTRVNSDMPVRYNFSKMSNNAKAVETKNISIGGICMSIDEKLALHDQVSLEIELPGLSASINAKGEIVWVKENRSQSGRAGIRHFDVGIEFKDLAPKGKSLLFKFLKECGNLQCE